MEITLKIPDELAQRVASEGKEPARVALEALALEGYRTERLSESAIRQMLGFDSRIQVHEAGWPCNCRGGCCEPPEVDQELLCGLIPVFGLFIQAFHDNALKLR